MVQSVPQQLGVRPVINAAATLTKLGGSIMPPEVVEAMSAASRS
jgi:L-seryl-tRNA(Ser) seleniumtransferase